MRFNKKILNEDDFNEQCVVTMELESSVTVLEVIKLIPKDYMYQAKLEQNYKKLVYMETVCDIIAGSLNLFVASKTLDKHSYERATQLYEQFIDKSRSWEEITSLIEGARF